VYWSREDVRRAALSIRGQMNLPHIVRRRGTEGEEGTRKASGLAATMIELNLAGCEFGLLCFRLSLSGG
jgi:hypothetical protein